MKDDMPNSQGEKERDQQRALLQAFLKESEQKVPSVGSQILLAIKQEQKQQPVAVPYQEQRALSPLSGTNRESRKERAPISEMRKSSRRWYVLSSLAVAAILIAVIGLFSRFILLRSSVNDAGNGASPVLTQSPTWSSVVLASVKGNQLTIANYDPSSGKKVVIATTRAPGGTTIDGVSHDGYHLLYHVYDGEQTLYYVVPRPVDGAFYSAAGRSGNGVWSTDGTTLYISTPQGIQAVNTLNGSAMLVVGLPLVNLHFYRNGYLYFSLSTQQQGIGVLQRMQVTTHVVQRITDCANGSNFWISPGGSTIYYTCGAQDALHAVNSDGSEPRVFRENAGPLIGYAADGSLLTLRTTSGGNQVVKLGGDPLLDTVLLSDVTPQAQPLQGSDVAVAPYGGALVARGIYSDHLQRLWFGDLLKGQSQFITTITNGPPVQVIGWDRLRIPGTTPIAQPTLPLPLSAWHNVLVASADNTGTLLTNNDIHNGSYVSLGSTHLPADTHIDGISPDGKNVLYHFSSSGHTLYYTLLSVPHTGYFYELNDENAGNAIWLPDAHHVLISSVHNGVIKVDIQTGQAVSVLPHLKTAGLTFYRAPYLYFIGAEDRATGALYRVNFNVDTAVPQQVTLRSPNTTFWLSPLGDTVYYVNKGSAGQPGLHAVKSDGTNFETVTALRPDGVPVGYASDNTLMIMKEVRGKFELVQLGETPQQDKVILADVVPGAANLCDSPVAAGVVPICERSIALAPLGGKLMVEAGYADGSRKVWSIDVRTQARFQLATPASSATAQLTLIGWDQISPASA